VFGWIFLGLIVVVFLEVVLVVDVVIVFCLVAPLGVWALLLGYWVVMVLGADMSFAVDDITCFCCTLMVRTISCIWLVLFVVM